MGITGFVSEIKRVENYPDFEKLAHVIQHGLPGFIAKISKVSQWRQTILILFCRSGSVAWIIQILPKFSQNLTLQEAFEIRQMKLLSSW